MRAATASSLRIAATELQRHRMLSRVECEQARQHVPRTIAAAVIISV